MEGELKKAHQKIVEVEKLEEKVVTLYGRQFLDAAYEPVCQVVIHKNILMIPLDLIPDWVRFIKVNVS